SLDSQDQHRRVAAVVERAPGRDEPGGSAPADSVRSRELPAVASAPGARGETGHHGAVAGAGTQSGLVRRHGSDGPPLRTELLAGSRSAHPAANGARGAAVRGSRLTDTARRRRAEERARFAPSRRTQGGTRGNRR